MIVGLWLISKSRGGKLTNVSQEDRRERGKEGEEDEEEEEEEEECL